MQTIEVEGRVKWFDPGKGYGFVAQPNSEDVLLHVRCLRSGGFHTAYEGSRIKVQALRRSKGLQAFRVLHLDDSTALPPSPDDAPHKPRNTADPISGWTRVRVKWFNRVRGYGFLTCGSGCPDIFIHMETVRHFRFTELQPGQIIQARWGSSPKGLVAVEIREDGLY